MRATFTRDRFRTRLSLLLSQLALALGLLSVQTDGEEGPQGGVATAERIASSPIENLYRLSPRLYSGAQPEGDMGFAALKQMGIRTIISVDGATPDVGAARKQGLRYVHLPIGYDGIPPAQGLRTIKAVRDLPGPVFIHCHHGKHRGPAAAALCAVASEGWTRDQALDWMRSAGTSADYRGLYRSVRLLPLPTAAELKDVPAEFSETAPVSTMIEIMVQVDRDWDRLKEDRGRNFRMPQKVDEATAAQTALQLAERFRELARLETAESRGQKFVAMARRAGDAAHKLHQGLKELEKSDTPGDRKAVDAAWKMIAGSCVECHKRYRDESEETVQP
ncbi:MAG TPA: hypothetical protein VL475_08260 [Planctomycetaceae bacterium]|nr:hypothetical protein [Planctomycetaceae bacterium]